MKAQALLTGGADTQEYSPLIELSTYMNQQVRRQVLSTMLSTLREYNHCSISNQLCILVLDSIKTMIDVIDLVSMQKFVIQEFQMRHKNLYEIHR